MKKSTKKLILAVVCVLVVVGILLGVYLATRPKPVQGAKGFTVTVTHKDGGEKTFTYRTDEEFLGPVLVQEGLIRGEDSAYGLMVLTVDGEDAVYADDGAYWAFYEGDQYANQGVDQTPVTDGAAYGFVYTLG